MMLNDLSSLKWEKRIILVTNVANKNEILALFEKNIIKINHRDIVWFIIKNDHVVTNYSGKLSEDFLNNTCNKYKVGQSKVLLIGKDSAIKSIRDHMDLAAIFLEIDAMPMRQTEMRNR